MKQMCNNRKSIMGFWFQTIRTHKAIDRLQLVNADSITNYDRADNASLWKIVRKALARCVDVEVRVNSKKFVTFIMTTDDRIFDL